MHARHPITSATSPQARTVTLARLRRREHRAAQLWHRPPGGDGLHCAEASSMRTLRRHGIGSGWWLAGLLLASCVDFSVPAELRRCPSPPCVPDADVDEVPMGPDAASTSAPGDIATDRPADARPADDAIAPDRPADARPPDDAIAPDRPADARPADDVANTPDAPPVIDRPQPDVGPDVPPDESVDVLLADVQPDLPRELPVDAPAANGMACTTAGECTSGFCVDGVCCNAACAGACESCALAGSAGICSPVAAGTDPDLECPTDPVSTCMRDGVCNGAGACRLYTVGTACAAQMCAAGVETPARVCNGVGTCQTGTIKNCSPYACQNAVCGTTCTGTTGCVTGFYCDGVQCLPK